MLKPEDDTETPLREATASAWNSLKQMADETNLGTPLRSIDTCLHLHEDCAIMVVLDGKYTTGRPGTMQWPDEKGTLSSNVRSPFRSKNISNTGVHIENIKLLHVGGKSAAYVQVEIIELKPCESDSDDRSIMSRFQGYMVFLKDSRGDGSVRTSGGTAGWVWKCISVVLSVNDTLMNRTGSCPTKTVPQPQDFVDVTSLVWDGYCSANRQCDGKLMSESFHHTCRLTYSMLVKQQVPQAQQNNDKPKDKKTNYQIVICESDKFYEKVQGRYVTEEMHLPFKHLQNHPDVGKWDDIQSIEFCCSSGGVTARSSSPDLAVVVLTVGHPPFLWTDMLICAKIAEEEDGDGQEKKKKWWIVHKSSENEPHPLPTILQSSS